MGLLMARVLQASQPHLKLPQNNCYKRSTFSHGVCLLSVSFSAKNSACTAHVGSPGAGLELSHEHRGGGGGWR